MSRSMAEMRGEKRACIIVVAKCPLPGVSKTRLIPLLGPEGAAKLAEAMLLDVLESLGSIPDVSKVILYAPPNNDAQSALQTLLDAHNLSEWDLRPVAASAVSVASSDLTGILQDALRWGRRETHGPVVFLGMDSPEVPVVEVVAAIESRNECVLCPAADGGYGMLSIPPQVDSLSCFRGVLWSHPLTALSQLKALSDQGVRVTLGPLMHDIDEPDDVKQLGRRLVQTTTDGDSDDEPDDCLQTPSALVQARQERTAPPTKNIPGDEQAVVVEASSDPSTLLLETASSWIACLGSQDTTSDTQQRPCRHTRRVLNDLGHLPSACMPLNVLHDLQSVWAEPK